MIKSTQTRDRGRNMTALERLKAMASFDLDAPGEWSLETANERCREYAALIHEFVSELEGAR